jgi:hypothetical protein
MKSVNGERLQERFEQQMANDMSMMAAKKKTEPQVLATVEQAWVDWSEEEDIRIFSRFLLYVMLVLHRMKTASADL